VIVARTYDQPIAQRDLTIGRRFWWSRATDIPNNPFFRASAFRSLSWSCRVT